MDKKQYAAWSDSFNAYSVVCGIDTKEAITKAVTMVKPYEKNLSSFRVVQIPPPEAMNLLQEVLEVGTSGHMGESYHAVQVMNKVRKFLEKQKE